MTQNVGPGMHLLVDFFGACNLQDEKYVEQALRDAAEACGATVLQILMHQFGAGGGVTGVALLAESHVTIHTWPETRFAAIDIFMCGKCDPERAIPLLQARFAPEQFELVVTERGRLSRLAAR